MFGEFFQFHSVGCVELVKRNTLVVSESQELAGVSRKTVGKSKMGGGGATYSGHGSKKDFSGICRARKNYENGANFVEFQQVELQKSRFFRRSGCL